MKVHDLFQMDDKRDVEMESYEFYEVIFWFNFNDSSIIILKVK